jgi:hypothetical protein
MTMDNTQGNMNISGLESEGADYGVVPANCSAYMK